MVHPLRALSVIVCAAALGAARPAAGQQALPPEPPAAAVERLLTGTPGGLDADAAALRARRRAPALAGARAAAERARAAAEEALVALLPRLTLTASYTRLSEVESPSFIEPPDPAAVAETRALVAQVQDPAVRALLEAQLDRELAQTGFRFPVILNQRVVRAAARWSPTDAWLRLGPTLRAARAEEAAARAREGAESREVGLAAVEAFYALATARAAEALAALEVAEVRSHRDEAARRAAEGVLARVEVELLEVQLALARLALARATAGADAADTALRVLLGMDPDEALASGEDFTAIAAPDVTPRAELEAAALQGRAELRALREGLRAARARAEAAQGGAWPVLALELGADLANPNPRIIPAQEEWRATWDASATLSWSPNDAATASAQAEARRAEAEEIAAELATLQDAVRTELGQLRAEAVGARAAAEAAREGLAAADAVYRARAAAFRQGTISARDLVQAQLERAQTRLELARALVDVRLADARLRAAVGP